VFSQGLGIWHHWVFEAATWLQLMACAILHILSTSRTLIWSAVPASMVALSTLKVWFSPLYNPSYCQQPWQQNSCYICRSPYKIQVLTQLRKKDWSSYAKTDLHLLLPQKGCSMNVDYVVRRDCEMGLHSKVIIFLHQTLGSMSNRADKSGEVECWVVQFCQKFRCQASFWYVFINAQPS
jgi:hypothetical protein